MKNERAKLKWLLIQASLQRMQGGGGTVSSRKDTVSPLVSFMCLGALAAALTMWVMLLWWLFSVTVPASGLSL